MNKSSRDPDGASDSISIEVSAVEKDLLLALRKLGTQGDYLIRGMSTLIQSMPPIPPRIASAQRDRELVELDAMTQTEYQRANREIAQGALALLQIRTWLSDAWETLSLDSTSVFLHRTPVDVVAAVDRGELLAVEIGGEQRFPAWQFTTRPVGHVLPHLAELLPELLKRWKPLVIAGFFTTRQEDLIGEGMKTPAAWLEDGGDPAEILAILESSDYR